MHLDHVEKRLPKLIYIMGDGRSGSTALSCVLGNHPDIESVGELAVWPRYRGHTKSGNQKIEDHVFWNSVYQEFTKNWPQPAFEELIGIYEKIESYAHFFNLIFSRKNRMEKQIYMAHCKGLLLAIQHVSKKSIIVDSSKKMGRAWMLYQCLMDRICIIFLVRDPRATLWSQLRTGIEQEYKSPLKAMLHYDIKNLLSLVVQWLVPDKLILRLRYEDFVLKPDKELERIGRFIDLPMDNLIKGVVNGVKLNMPHLLDGNRIRSEKEIKLNPDMEWRRKLPRCLSFFAAFCSFPFFILFGYWKYKYESE